MLTQYILIRVTLFMLVNIFCPEHDLVNTSNCGDEFLREITVEMAIDPVVNIRVMTELLQKALLERKDIDRHIINNSRIRAHRKKLELDYLNIQIDPKHFDKFILK